MEPINLLALSGSLRKTSYNTAALEALQVLAPEHIDIHLGEISSLPLFNPDRENDTLPALKKLKSSLNKASGLIIASPEYAHGISGPLKNALDWLVSGVEFPSIPIMLINTSPRASHAIESLQEILRTMSGIVVQESSVSIALLGSNLDATSIANNQHMSTALLTGLNTFYDQIKCLN